MDCWGSFSAVGRDILLGGCDITAGALHMSFRNQLLSFRYVAIALTLNVVPGYKPQMLFDFWHCSSTLIIKLPSKRYCQQWDIHQIFWKCGTAIIQKRHGMLLKLSFSYVTKLVLLLHIRHKLSLIHISLCNQHKISR